jgi:antibiotic biosynthesis monooxygenase (ABM) superfamily enzyme
MLEIKPLNEEPVTVIITRYIKPGSEKTYEKRMAGIIQQASKFEGFMGANIIPPVKPLNPEYIIIFKFNNLENLRKWEESAILKTWVEQAQEFTLADFNRQLVTGEVYLFGLPQQLAKPQPPRYKVALVTWLGIFPLSLLIKLFLGTYINLLPLILQSFVTATLLVSCMVYLVMPQINKITYRWLYGSDKL